MTTKGTKEWADSNVNAYFGCSNNCSYCYAKRMAIRFGRKTEDNWNVMEPNQKAINKQYRKRNGRIMFPTSHDITKESFKGSAIILFNLLEAGNEVLLTTKPSWILENIRLECMAYPNQIQLRATITSTNNITLGRYEPNAPPFEERMEQLRKWYFCGLKTSVSIEPFLDKDPLTLIELVADYCTESIWLGIMSGKVPIELKGNYTKDNLELIVNNIKKLPLEVRSKVRLKDSIVSLLQLGGNRLCL